MALVGVKGWFKDAGWVHVPRTNRCNSGVAPSASTAFRNSSDSIATCPAWVAPSAERTQVQVGGADYVVRSMGDVSYFAAERERIQQEARQELRGLAESKVAGGRSAISAAPRSAAPHSRNVAPSASAHPPLTASPVFSIDMCVTRSQPRVFKRYFISFSIRCSGYWRDPLPISQPSTVYRG